MRKLAVLAPVLFTIVAIAAIAACATPADDAGPAASESAFTQGDYIQENDPHYWAPSTFEEFQAAGRTFGVAPPQTLATDDPLTVRLQAWLDRVDAVVRSDIEHKSGAPLAAPKPIAKILVSKSGFNAWVSGVPACVGASPTAPGANSAFFDRDQVQRFAGFIERECLRPATWSGDGFMKFWNSDKPACALTSTADSVAVTGKTCVQGPAISAAPEQLLVTATGQYVQFTTDLLAVIDETTLAVVAAHELGHYYRGHTTDKARARYNFWFQEDAAQKKTPVPAKDAAALKAAYLEVVQGVKPANGPSFASKYSERLRPLLLAGLAPLLLERKEPDFACAAARDALGPWTEELQHGEAPSAATRASFLDFEAKLVSCAPSLALNGEPGAKSVSGGSVLFAGAKYRPGPKTKVSISFSGDTLGAFLGRLDLSARDLDTKAAKLLQHMRDNRIGLYTIEQEADDFAMDLATKLGFSVDEILQGWVSFMAAADRMYLKSVSPERLQAYYQSIGERDAASCAALLKDGFTQDDGAGNRVPVTMSLGRLDEPHHTSCYRLWNLAREASVQHFVAGPKQQPLAPDWADLRAEAATVAAGAL